MSGVVLDDRVAMTFSIGIFVLLAITMECLLNTFGNNQKKVTSC